jgi:hypothetical protein
LSCDRFSSLCKQDALPWSTPRDMFLSILRRSSHHLESSVSGHSKCSERPSHWHCLQPRTRHFYTCVSVGMRLMKLKCVTVRHAGKPERMCQLTVITELCFRVSVSMLLKSKCAVGYALDNAFLIQDGSSAFNNSSSTSCSQCSTVEVGKQRNKQN